MGKDIRPRFSDSISSAYVQIKRISIRAADGFRSQFALGVTAPFECKDALKEWSKEWSGGWHPVEKIWYAPLSKENFSEVIDSIKGLECLVIGGAIDFLNVPDKVKSKVEACFDKDAVCEEEGVLFGEYSVFPEQESQYMSDRSSVAYGEELPQIQGFVRVFGQDVRVLVSRDEQDTSPDMIFNNHWKEFRDVDGSQCWAKPWQHPAQRDDWESWPKPVDEIGEDLPEKTAPVGLKVSLIVKKGSGEPIGLRAAVGSTERFWQCKTWCSQWEGSRWDVASQTWRLPYGEKILKDLFKFQEMAATSSFWANCRIEVSEGIKELKNAI